MKKNTFAMSALLVVFIGYVALNFTISRVSYHDERDFVLSPEKAQNFVNSPLAEEEANSVSVDRGFPATHTSEYYLVEAEQADVITEEELEGEEIVQSEYKPLGIIINLALGLSILSLTWLFAKGDRFTH